jgi:pimeloyl-ACP methyl ester carboxylesterase
VGEYIELPGAKTWYEVEGEGDPVLLLHGGFCTNETWGPQRAKFAANHRVFLPERRTRTHPRRRRGALLPRHGQRYHRLPDLGRRGSG